MRLSPYQSQILVQAAKESFDDTARVRLFGSRMDDTRKGGDIDLLIETALTDIARISKAHIRFLAKVYSKLGEQKIDVLIDSPAIKNDSPIYRIAKQGHML